jgi:hypothetical protein
MKRKLYLLLLSLWPGLVLAQHLERTIAENYPPDISLRVIAVTDAVDIDEDVQNKLAVHFLSEAAAVRSAASPEAAQELRQQYASEMAGLLGEEVVNEYYRYYATRDTLTDSNTSAEEREAFFEAEFEILNEAKPLSNDLKNSLRSTYDQVCSHGNGLKLSYNFKLAMQGHLSDVDYFYALHKERIDDIAWVNAVYYSHWYKQNWKTSDGATEKIFRAWQEKIKTTTALHFTYENEHETSHALINQVSENCDSLVTSYLMEDGVYRSSSSFWLAVLNADQLGLSEDQIRKLKEDEVQWKKWRNQNQGQTSGSWSFERNFYADGMLTDDQFNKLLVLKNSYAAFEKGKQMWTALKEKNLTWQSDSAVVVNQVGGYYTTLFVTRDFFENDPDAQESHMNAVYAMKPEPLKRLENEGQPGGETEPYRGTFLW